MKIISVGRQQSTVSNQQLLVKLLVLLITAHCSLFTVHCSAQGVGINIAGNPANSKALLDVDATGMNPMTGVLIPRMNTSNRNAITAPVPESLLIYNTDTHCYEAYYNGIWADWGCLACQVPSQPTPGTNISSPTQIVWNWSDASSPVNYECGTTTTYSSATYLGTSTSFTQTGLSCGTTYSLYVWAYNACGNSSYFTLTQTTGPACGTQIWACTNVNVGSQISESIPQTTNTEWCYGDVPANCTTYGGLYEWATAVGLPNTYNSINYNLTVCWETCNPCDSNGTQGICPTGYHIPTDLEWSQYEYCLDATLAPTDGNSATNTLSYFQNTTTWRGSTTVGVGAGSKMKATSWGNGTNTSGFAALPAGDTFDGVPSGLGSWTTFWSATEYAATTAWYRDLFSSAQSYRNYVNKAEGLSVRCLHN